MPRTTLPDPRQNPRLSGVCTFGRYPLLPLVPPDARPLDWAVYGVPYDTGVTFRPGARFGPRAIRDASQYLKRYHLEHRIDLPDTLSLADAGDAPVQPFHLKPTLDAVTTFAEQLADPTTKLLALGGDHSIAYANIKATLARSAPGRSAPGGAALRAAIPRSSPPPSSSSPPPPPVPDPRSPIPPTPPLALLHLDAHLDTVDQVWQEKHSHASPFLRLIEERIIDPARTLTLGVRGPLNTATDIDASKALGIRVVTADEARRHGEAIVREFIASLKGHPCYITFDVDCLDPAFAPGTGTPCPAGLTPWDAFGILRAAAGINLAGADVVEVLPDRDVAQNTALLAAHVAFEVLCLDALTRRTSA